MWALFLMEKGTVSVRKLTQTFLYFQNPILMYGTDRKRSLQIRMYRIYLQENGVS